METIAEALDRFRATRGHDLPHAAEVVDLLRRSLDAYAHQWLPDRERVEWEAAWPSEEEPTAFTDTFGPDRIPGNVAEFLGYFMIRRVEADGALLDAAGRVTAALLDWLVEEGHASQDDVAEPRETAEAAAEDLPRAAGLTTAFEHLARHPVAGLVLEERELADAKICRVEPGAIWFAIPEEDDAVGPVDVNADVAALAETGWGVSGLVLERTPTGWRIAEAGTVYPF